MSIADMNDRISAFADKDCGLGATAEEIAAAESALSASFPESWHSIIEQIVAPLSRWPFWPGESKLARV